MRPGWRGCGASWRKAGSPGSGASLGSEERVGLVLRWDRVGEVGGEEVMLLLVVVVVLPALLVLADPLVEGGASLKMCTVSVAELTQSKVEVALKLMQ